MLKCLSFEAHLLVIAPYTAHASRLEAKTKICDILLGQTRKAWKMLHRRIGLLRAGEGSRVITAWD
jgi:hypothetical protein